jgi:opacity protein-like surface antigen
MIKKLILALGVIWSLNGQAQSSNFEGASIGLNLNSNTLTTQVNSTTSIGDSSTASSIEGAYSFALNNDVLLSLGGTYSLSDLKAGTVAGLLEIKAKNLYTVYVEPAYVIGSTALYGKLAYIATKGTATAAGESNSSNFHGTAYGVGSRLLLNKNFYIQVEYLTTNFSSKTIDGTNIQPGGTIGTVGIGYKF